MFVSGSRLEQRGWNESSQELSSQVGTHINQPVPVKKYGCACVDRHCMGDHISRDQALESSAEGELTRKDTSLREATFTE